MNLYAGLPWRVGALRATYSGTTYAWRGVVKDGRRVVATCEHVHRNRDAGDSATGCARRMLRDLTREAE